MTESPFDTSYSPALPIYTIELIAPASEQHIELIAIIDTGADSSLVPIRYLTSISARRVFETGMRSQWGERRTVFLYIVDVRIDNLTLPGMYVVGDEIGNEVVLGRNILNRLRLMLDGPAQVTQLLK